MNDTTNELKALEDAKSAKFEAEMRCLRALGTLTEALNYGHGDETLGRKGAIRIIAEYYGDDSEEGLEAADYTIQEGLDAIKAFNDAHNQFLKAVGAWAQANRSAA